MHINPLEMLLKHLRIGKIVEISFIFPPKFRSASQTPARDNRQIDLRRFPDN